MNGTWRTKMIFRLIESSMEKRKHFDKLKSNTKYKLLTPEEARQKAIVSRGDAPVTFGYPDEMYEHLKGEMPYILLTPNISGTYYRVVGNDSYSISVDMVEPYTRVIKYNKDKL